MSRRARAAATICATAAVIVAAGGIALASVRRYEREARLTSTANAAAPSVKAKALPPVHASLPTAPGSYLGVYESSSLSSYALVNTFAKAISHQPNIVMYYSGWTEGFSVSYAQTAFEHGATLEVDLDPTNITLASIADGSQDGFLTSYAEAVRSFGHPVIISFGHEMNGTWYSWGYTQAKPANYVRAWRQVVDVFRQVGADNVTWLWTVNAVAVGESPTLAPWWPGANYVTWVGVDAYYYNAGATFADVFDPTLQAVRQITKKPVLVAETAIGQVAGQAAEIPGLFAGVRSAGLLGFIWYDQGQADGVFHQDWRLEGHPVALAEFRRSDRRYFNLVKA